jgi:glyoxylase-like metal-dependent hydrolase (beta-lactamase superfamily II)
MAIDEFDYLASGADRWPTKSPVPLHHFDLNGVRAEPPRVQVINDGMYAVDGGQVYSDTPRDVWQAFTRPDRHNRVTQALNLLVLQLPGLNVIIDTGLGHTDPAICKEVYRHSSSKILRNVRASGLSPRDIDLVVLSHLHVDHSGGAVKETRDGSFIPAFPRATYVVQAAAWQDAMSATGREERHYHHREQLKVLEEKNCLQLLDRDGDVGGGVWVVRAEGHSPGHQIVLANYGNIRIAYLADLAPTPAHLLMDIPYGPDRDREQVIDDRAAMLRWLADESWLCVFAHSTDTPAGFLNMRRGKLTLVPVITREDMSTQRIQNRMKVS